jgi:hypothetical protein
MSTIDLATAGVDERDDTDLGIRVLLHGQARHDRRAQLMKPWAPWDGEDFLGIPC